jgi:predicted DNA-binding transcriptional regulator YafY
MNRAQRIYAQHRLFHTHNLPVSRSRIQDELECSQATVKRIIAEMRNLLGVPYGDQRELIMEILKYGPDVEVLAPEELRLAVRERIMAAAKQYF